MQTYDNIQPLKEIFSSVFLLSALLVEESVGWEWLHDCYLLVDYVKETN